MTFAPGKIYLLRLDTEVEDAQQQQYLRKIKKRVMILDEKLLYGKLDIIQLLMFLNICMIIIPIIKLLNFKI